jgi:hypothetical protein
MASERTAHMDVHTIPHERSDRSSQAPRRSHYLVEWADSRGWRQADVARACDADKSLVSRWYKGATPGIEWRERLARVFSVEPEAFFAHPSDHWFKSFLAGRSLDEVDHIKKSLEVLFPRKSDV